MSPKLGSARLAEGIDSTVIGNFRDGLASERPAAITIESHREKIGYAGEGSRPL